jgi:hypothetical protein
MPAVVTMSGVLLGRGFAVRGVRRTVLWRVVVRVRRTGEAARRVGELRVLGVAGLHRRLRPRAVRLVVPRRVVVVVVVMVLMLIPHRAASRHVIRIGPVPATLGPGDG